MASVSHNYLWWFLLIIWVLCFSLFVALYVTAFAVTGDSATTTLSEMLSENIVVQQLYLIFMGSYIFITLDICFLVWVYDEASMHLESSGNTSNKQQQQTDLSTVARPSSFWSKHRLQLYDLTVAAYYILSLLKLIGFTGLFFYDCNTSHREHYILAAVGFISAVLSEWFLFFRRLVILGHELNQATGTDSPVTPSDQSPHPWIRVLLVLDLVYLLLVSSILISFAPTGNGILELLTVLLVVLGPLFLLWDFLRFPGTGGKLLITGTMKPVTKYRVPAKISYPKQLYHRLLFYYNNKTV